MRRSASYETLREIEFKLSLLNIVFPGEEPQQQVEKLQELLSAPKTRQQQ